jgi:amino acid adenylation domain-containing protein/non-ribosomal peptide synthase protein (TIGR01720 family)
VALILKEVFVLYDAYSQGRELELGPTRPFREYIRWLRQQDLNQAEAFWRRALAGVTEPTPIRVDNVIDALTGKEEFKIEQAYLSEAETTSLHSLARRRRLTMSALAHGAWALLLGRYSGQQDVVFGTVVAGRPPELEGVETMIGLFINTLPTRVRVAPDAGVVEWLQGMQAWQAEARRYEYSPLALVQGWSDVGRGASMFESIVAFENYPVSSAPLQGQSSKFRISNVEAVERINYPLFVVVGPGTELFLSINYDARRFEAETVERMLSHLRTLLGSIVAHPNRRLDDLSLLSPAEERQLLSEWNATEVVYPHGLTVAQLFEEQVSRTPDAVATVYEGRRLTYRELNRRANQLAHYLRKREIGPDTLVGLCVERSLETVVGLLGILKAGGAYVPLDQTYPVDRLAYMLRDARVKVLLTQQNFSESLPAERSAAPICLDTDSSQIGAEDTDDLPPLAMGENLAYVIYTSGSTGAPKGVQAPHRALVNFLHAMRGQLEFGAEDYLLAMTSISFDIAGLEIFLPLITGATVEIISRQIAADGVRLAERLNLTNASVMQATPVTWELLLEAGWCNDRGVKALCGGEALPRGLATKLLEGAGPVWNLYGPTETTIWSTAQQVRNKTGILSIGQPINNTQIYITDKNLRPAPAGVPGELYIGGDGVGRGYLGRADTTAERFVPNPFCSRYGERLYRTGDLTRRLPDGQIEFLGRLDHQVKVRGHRVELGEIEHALSQHARVRQSVVVAREDAPGKKRIVAYYVAAGGEGGNGAAAPGADELREYLRERLPDYMAPGAFVSLAEFPLTPSGKIDRQALPEPGGRESVVENEEPRTELEAILAEVWREALEVEHVGMRDNFFELGGDSILSMRVVGRARARGVELSPAEMFRHQSVAALAAAVQARQNPPPARLSGTVTLTPIQRWFFEMNQPAPNHFNQAVMLELSPKIKPAILAQVVEELVARHDALRARFNNEGGRWRQVVVGPEGVSAVTARDLSAIPVARRAEAIEALAEEIQTSLNLTEGPLFRAVFIKLGARRSARLLLMAHHLTVDLSTWRILLEELQGAYQQLNRGEPLTLPQPGASFGRWAQKLSEWADSEESLSEANYWLDQARAAIAPLPVDFDRGLNVERSASALITTLSDKDTRTLLHEAPKAFRALPNEVLLTALALAGTRWTDQDKFLVDVEGHGREDLFPDLDLSRTVGWFTAIYPVLVDLSEATTALEVLKLVKKQVRAVPRGGIGYGALKYLSHRDDIAARLQAMPQAEVSFNYIGPTAAAKQTGGHIRLAKEGVGRLVSELNSRPYLLMVCAQIENQRLVVNWTYSENIHRRETIRKLAGFFEEALHDLIAGCERKAEGHYMSSDFPNANLNQTELDEFLSRFA